MVLPEKASSARLKAAGRLAMGGGAFFGGRVGIGGGAGISAQLTASCESLGSGAAPVTVDDAQLPCSSTRGGLAAPPVRSCAAHPVWPTVAMNGRQLSITNASSGWP